MTLLATLMLHAAGEKLEILHLGFAVSAWAPVNIQHEQKISVRPKSVVRDLCGADGNVIDDSARAIIEK